MGSQRGLGARVGQVGEVPRCCARMQIELNDAGAGARILIEGIGDT